MRITHIYHSGFSVELSGCTLLFDWYTGELPKLRHDLPLVVFVSHEHSDHYGPHIWELDQQFSQVCYVVDETVGAMAPDSANIISTKPHENYTVPLAKDIDAMQVKTLKSNDEGVAFLVQACGKTLYFSGDLNAWWWDRPQKLNEASDHFFRTELARIANETVDAAFVPLDPRLKDPIAGMVAYIEVVGAQALLPMHYWDNKAAAQALLNDERIKPFVDHIHFEDVCELPD
jgi:L-ascorbate metabolism protein UlaG (beta-lactamase superfamily)